MTQQRKHVTRKIKRFLFVDLNATDATFSSRRIIYLMLAINGTFISRSKPRDCCSLLFCLVYFELVCFVFESCLLPFSVISVFINVTPVVSVVLRSLVDVIAHV